MQIDALTLQLRPRSMYEAADLGVRMAQSGILNLGRSYAPLALCVFAISVASAPLGSWLPFVIVFMVKPWLDRTLLFIFSRAAFGIDTRWADLWRARRQVWFGRFLHTITLRRLSPRRSYNQAVHQLEGLRGQALRKRLALLRYGKGGVSVMITSGFSLVETSLTLAISSLFLWLAPPEHRQSVFSVIFAASDSPWSFVVLAIYPAVALLVEPFYVAAGFAMYLNRRVELEAWDIEQELRRVFR